VRALPTERDPEAPFALLKRIGVPDELLAHAASALNGKLDEVLRQNPYSLCESLGASFVEVDTLALENGFPREDPKRLRVGLLALMRTEEGEGSCYSVRTAFVRRAARVLQTSSMAAERALDQMAREGRVLLDGERLWSRRLSEIEAEVAQRILWLCTTEAEAKEAEPARQKRALRAVPEEAL
jgi:exodeoxyribonuclease V alpha subunit